MLIEERKLKVSRLSKQISSALFWISLTGLTSLLFISYFGESVGDYVIDVDRVLYINGFVAADNQNFENPTARLSANSIRNVYPITYSEIPHHDTMNDGADNGRNYFAYTFYVQNGGRDIIDFVATIDIIKVQKNVDAAVRVKVVVNDFETIYAKARDDGSPEEGTVPFDTSTRVMTQVYRGFAQEEVLKYTVIIWIEGYDIDTTDEGPNSIKGGTIKFGMNFAMISRENS